MSDRILTMQDIQDIIEEIIVNDLRDPSLTYTDICSRHRVGINRVVAVAKKHNLPRKRGRITGRKLYWPAPTTNPNI